MRFHRYQTGSGFRIRQWLGCLLVGVTLFVSLASAQTSQSPRKIRNKVMPVYPELARKLRLVATVKVQVTVAPSGAVLEAKPIGGHPLLIAPSVDAARQFRYEPGGETSTAILEFHFAPADN
jgi:hypothetical protein